MTCKRCGSNSFHEIDVDNMHERGMYCAVCGQFIKWMPTVDLGEMEVPFKKHKGKLVKNAVPEDPSYFRWLLDKGILKEGRLKTAVESYL